MMLIDQVVVQWSLLFYKHKVPYSSCNKGATLWRCQWPPNWKTSHFFSHCKIQNASNNWLSVTVCQGCLCKKLNSTRGVAPENFIQTGNHYFIILTNFKRCFIFFISFLFLHYNYIIYKLTCLSGDARAGREKGRAVLSRYVACQRQKM